MSDLENDKERLFMKVVDIIVGIAVLIVVAIIVLQRNTSLLRF